MKVIIKKPEDEVGIMTEIDNDLETLQEIVGGYIEVLPYYSDCIIICNEDGKSMDLKPNIHYDYFDYIVGTIIVCGRKDDEFDDVPITIEEWKKYIN